MQLARTLAMVPRGSGDWSDVRDAFVEAQAGQCAICRESVEDAPNLDHCHVTGFIRGVLCTSCNVKLGWYEGRRREIESYLANAAEHAAHVTPKRLSKAERWRKYWKTKELG